METFTEKQGCEIIAKFLGRQVRKKSFDTCIEAMRVYYEFKDAPRVLTFSDEDYLLYYSWRERFNRALVNYDIKQVFVLTVSAIKWFTKTIVRYG